jgi:hypothetical protein
MLPSTVVHFGVESADNSYSGLSIADIIRRESANELSAEKYLCVQNSDGQIFGFNTDDEYLLNFMPVLQQLYTRLMVNNQLPVVATFVQWAARPGFKLTLLGEKIFAACEYFAAREEEGRDWRRAYAHHQFHPVIAVMLRAVMNWWAPISASWDPRSSLVEFDADREAMEALHAFAAFVRRVCRSVAFQNLLHDHEKKAEDNFRSGCDFVTELFERHSRVLVLRIDLYFRPDAKGWGYGATADKAVTNYLRALRSSGKNRIAQGYLGFIIKRENGISRGMHYHLMVFLDGHLHRSAYHLTQRLGEAWLKRVGTDKGSFFNCYARKDHYRYNGLGLVQVGDFEKLLGIRIALWYMSKQDCVLKVDDSKVKNFWRTPSKKGKIKRGAPRNDRSSMNSVKRLLSGKRSKYSPTFEQGKTQGPCRASPLACARGQAIGYLAEQ